MLARIKNKNNFCVPYVAARWTKLMKSRNSYQIAMKKQMKPRMNKMMQMRGQWKR